MLEVTVASAPILLGLGFFAGALNAVAGGGTFFMFPSLVLMGMPPIIANVTGKLGLSLASFSSVYPYRKELAQEGARSWHYLLAGFLGSALGSVLLLFMSAEGFRLVAPWLLLFAVLVFVYGSKRVVAAVQGKNLPYFVSLFVQLLIGVYGGFFAAGMGLMMMALYAVSRFSSLHHINGVKNLVGLGINAVSAVIFAFSGLVSWPVALCLIVGAVFGGYSGARLARHVPQQWLRLGIIVYGVVMSAYMLFGM